MTGILFFLQEVRILEALAFCTIAFLLAPYSTLMLLSSVIFITRCFGYDDPHYKIQNDNRRHSEKQECDEKQAHDERVNIEIRGKPGAYAAKYPVIPRPVQSLCHTASITIALV